MRYLSSQRVALQILSLSSRAAVVSCRVELDAMLAFVARPLYRRGGRNKPCACNPNLCCAPPSRSHTKTPLSQTHQISDIQTHARRRNERRQLFLGWPCSKQQPSQRPSGSRGWVGVEWSRAMGRPLELSNRRRVPEPSNQPSLVSWNNLTPVTPTTSRTQRTTDTNGQKERKSLSLSSSLLALPLHKKAFVTFPFPSQKGPCDPGANNQGCWWAGAPSPSAPAAQLPHARLPAASWH